MNKNKNISNKIMRMSLSIALGILLLSQSVSIAKEDNKYIKRFLLQDTKMTDERLTELVDEVIWGLWGNGEERRNELTKFGYDYKVIQDEVNKYYEQNEPTIVVVQEKKVEQKSLQKSEQKKKVEKKVTPKKQTNISNNAKYSLKELQFHGVINWGGYKFTYYSQSVLNGNGLNIPGRHINAGGYVADKDGYIVLANDAPKGTIINTPFGYKGKVYDRGTYGNHFDVYTK